MFVCVCNAVRDRQIAEAAREGVCSVKGLCLATRAGTTCGKCLPEAKRLLEQALAEQGGVRRSGQAA